MKVLYATDGREPSFDAGSALIRFADPRKVDITVVSVAEIGLPMRKHAIVALQSRRDKREGATRIADAAVERLKSAGFSATSLVLEGKPIPALRRAQRDGEFDLVVTGAGRLRSVGAWLLGSVGREMVHKGPASALVVHHAPSFCDRILVGVDGSDESDAAIDLLARFARPEVPVTVLSVAAVLAPRMWPPGAAYVAGDAMATNIRRDAELANQRAARAARRLQDAGFTATPQMVLGHPATRLKHEAEVQRCGLVVLGSRHLGAFQRAAVDATSKKTAAHVPAALIARLPVDAKGPEVSPMIDAHV